ncbi:MAG TPA: SAM-dependent methyltransferase [Polyangia bacterium]|nr:SAM-dependent methyltransferase [Polyangia bacterium]
MGEPLIRGVPDTAFMVASWRARESERGDALFRDPFAALLAGTRGPAMADELSGNPLARWQVVVRTAVIDAMLREAVSRGVRTVVNLGAGLDAHPYRLSWPASLRWLDVDFAEVLDWKSDRLRQAEPTCCVEQIKMDLTDGAARRRLFAEIGAASPATLVLTEGVIPYLTEAAVGQLADDLRGLPGVSWIVDYFAPQILPFRKRLRVSRAMRAAPFQFEPPDWFGFFAGHGWRAADIKYLAIEAERLGRPAPLPALLKAAVRVSKLLGPPQAPDAFKKFAGYVLLEPLALKEQV